MHVILGVWVVWVIALIAVLLFAVWLIKRRDRRHDTSLPPLPDKDSDGK